MKKLLSTLCPTGAALMLAALPLLATAQNTRQDSLLRRGDLVGGRPRTTQSRTTTTTRTTTVARRPAPANADPFLASFLHESIDLNRLPTAQLLAVYERFMEATRAQRRQWSAQEWDAASAALSRLNARYEAVRLDLPLDDRLTVRSYQGEFRTLQGARRLQDKVSD